MIRICISGLTGSGKTTSGELLAKELEVAHITKAQTQSYSVISNELKRTKDKTLSIGQMAVPKYAKDFDREIVKEAAKKDCVVSTWLSPWLVKDATLRIWLACSFEERVRRKAKQLGMSIPKARAYVKEKDSYAEKSFKKIYGIDINDHSVFDLEINTEKLDHREAVAIVSMLSMLRDKKRF